MGVSASTNRQTLQRDPRITNIENQHGAIRTEYAAFNQHKQLSDQIKATADAIKPIRSKTQPVELPEAQIVTVKNLQVIQVALLSVLLALVGFLIVPSPYASIAGFLALCVGASVGIYLSTR
jgi:hypothetical protein